MMTQKKSRFGAAKVLLALPVAAMLLFVNCKTNVDIPDHFEIEDGTYELAGGIVDTYKDGQLVQRVIGSVEVPLEEIGDHMVLPSQKEAKEFSSKFSMPIFLPQNSNFSFLLFLDWYIAYNII